jgi:hypothetical protein
MIASLLSGMIEAAAWSGARRKVMCPLVLRGERATVGRLYNVMKTWQDHAV